MKRTGIYGGSFDPVHNGHIHLAETAAEQFSLDEIVFVPARVSPFKQDKKDVTPDADRLEMLRLSLEGQDNMSISDYELMQDGVSYTVYTLRYMKKIRPSEELVLLMGSDMLMSFPKWYCWQEIMSLAELGCISRNFGDSGELAQQAQNLSAYGKVSLYCGDILPVSSTQIRDSLKKGEDCSCYLSENVVQYILRHKLYGV